MLAGVRGLTRRFVVDRTTAGRVRSRVGAKTMTARLVTLFALALVAVPARAHHRQTPPIVQITTTGDAFLPRVPAFRGRLVLALGAPGRRQIFRRERDGVTLTPLTVQGDNENPSVSATGRITAWDSDGDLLGAGDPGRQVYVLTASTLSRPAHDPTGTSVTPALDARGQHLAFVSRGDLAGTGNAGALQVFVHGLSGVVEQVSRGDGTSEDPVYDKRGQTLVFDSTSDPVTGVDTGIAQVWVAAGGTPAVRLTDGQGASRRAAISSRGRFVAFESTADLAGGGLETGVSQVFACDRLSGNFARVTNEPGGCRGVSVDETPGDWRVVYVCGGQGFLHFLRTDRRLRLPIDAGTTAQAVAELGNFFVAVSTTADLINGGVASGYRIFQLNLFKLAAVPVGGAAVWFPDPAFRP